MTETDAIRLENTLRELQAENSISIDHLRGVLIPQQVGMVAAGRLLAAELPSTVARDLASSLESGELARRWDVALESASELRRREERQDDTDDRRAGGVFWVALVALLQEQARRGARHLLQRSREWSAQAYRLEGRADELVVQNQKLVRLLAAAGSAGSDDAPGASPVSVLRDLESPGCG